MISLWVSKKYKEAINLSQVVGFAECENHHEAMFENGRTITVHQDEVDDFMQALKDYTVISEIVTMGLVPEGDIEKKILTKKHLQSTETITR